MKKALSAIPLFALALTLLASGTAIADDDLAGVLGEVHITLNSDYPKVEVNGSADWGAVEFEKKGKKVIIKNLPLDEAISITLTPIYETLLPQTLSIETKEFRKKRKGRTYLMVAKKKVVFAKNPNAVKTEPAPTPEKAPEPVPDDSDDDL